MSLATETRALCSGSESKLFVHIKERITRCPFQDEGERWKGERWKAVHTYDWLLYNTAIHSYNMTEGNVLFAALHSVYLPTRTCVCIYVCMCIWMCISMYKYILWTEAKKSGHYLGCFADSIVCVSKKGSV